MSNNYVRVLDEVLNLDILLEKMKQEIAGGEAFGVRMKVIFISLFR